MDFSNITQKILSWAQKILSLVPSVDLGMEAKTFFLLVALLLFLISLLINLLQRRSSKARFDRMLKQEESVVSFLEAINKYLNDLEWTCSIEMHGASSPQEMAKAIGAIRNKVEVALADLRVHLQSFRQYRKKEKDQKKDKQPKEKREPTLRGF
jgi:hypothetical protein